MVRDPESIERDIEKARDAFAATLDQITVRANPKRLADSAKAGAMAKLNEPKIKYPLIGAGVLVGILLVRKLFRRRSER